MVAESRFAQPPVFEVVGHVDVTPPPQDALTAAGPNQARAPKGTPIGGQWIDAIAGLLSKLPWVDRGDTSPLVVSEETLPRLAGDHAPVSGSDTDRNGTPYGDEAADAANRIHDKAEANEPTITNAMTSAMAEGGMDPSGLEFRLKEQDSMARKIRDDAPLKGGTNAAAAGIFDATRYTGLADPENFTASAQTTLDSLREQGYQVVQVKNTWNSPDVAYRGVNVKVVSPSGDQIELQFHTPDSNTKKFEMHALYEAQRLLEKGTPEWQDLEDQMWAMSSSLETPPGIETLH